MNQTEPVRAGSGVAIAVGLVLTTVLVALLFVLMGTSTYDIWGAVIIAPILILITLPALARQASREGDRRLFAFLVVALLVKLVVGSVLLRYYFAIDLYGGLSDAARYDNEGTILAQRFRAGNFDTGLTSLTGTNFMEFFTGVLYTVIGPSRLGGFVFYSWLGFWGLFFFYRAFTLAVPEGRNWTYRTLLFFLPSLVYWPSSIGKEAWMIFALGIAALGAAHVLNGRMGRGLLVSSLGLWLAWLPRPHMAGLVAAALGAAFVLRPVPKRWGVVAPVAKGVSLIIVGALAVFVVVKADQFLQEKGIDAQGGLSSALGQVTERTDIGGSYFAPSILESPVRAPAAIGTVLFRPSLLEAHNAQALLAAVETSFLFLYAIARLPWSFAALRLLRRRPYVAFAFIYTGLFIVGFSSVANFGLLARERVQLFPLFLVLLSIPPLKTVEERADSDTLAGTGART